VDRAKKVTWRGVAMDRAKKMMWRGIAIAGMAFILVNCGSSQISQADIIGEYRADVPPGLATLIIKQDYTWEYHIDGPQYFARSGKWVTESDLTTSSTYTVTLERFESGFPLFDYVPPSIKFDQQKPGFLVAQFEKDYTGKVSTCIRIRKYCFKHS
jgi:hypothetical protein